MMIVTRGMASILTETPWTLLSPTDPEEYQSVGASRRARRVAYSHECAGRPGRVLVLR